ncbi:MAG: FAD-dependent oxidoreductase [Gammaproteobacteria bacterium]|nr:MAG: FAD-dependent oxidoreductase [Gammaproteobacteria bacterium]
MATPWSKNYKGENHTFRKFREGDDQWSNWEDQIFNEDHSHRCPTYVHRTPPCQGSCPSGEDIRGYLQIVRGMEQPPEGMTWQEYAFRRSTDANPFPAMMGRVCPAPCQDGCNRNEVEDFVGINSIEQFIGDNAIKEGYAFEKPETESGKKVAIIGGGPAGMAAAYQLRRKGHGAVIFDDNKELGGMMRYGIPGYRTPRDTLDAEIKRIIDMGVEARMETRVGRDVSMEELDKEFDAVLWALGCQSGRGLPVAGWDDAPNCVSGVAFLKAFNEGRMHVTADKVVCVGGGDTSIDVVSVARRLGHIEHTNPTDRPELVVRDGFVAHDSAITAARQGADVTLTSLFKQEEMTAAEHEVNDALTEGVTILDGVIPMEVILGDDGRATGLKVSQCVMEDGRPVPVEGTEKILEADLIVSAIGQGGDLEGLDGLGNERNLIDSDKNFCVPNRPGHFVAGDIIRPHLLTTAIGQASIAVDSIDHYLKHEEFGKRPKVDVHHFDLLDKLDETKHMPEHFDPSESNGPRPIDQGLRGTASENFAVHNYEDRALDEIISSEMIFLAHFDNTPRFKREEEVPSSEEVLGHFQERLICLPEEQAIDEAKRCMSCGLCFECDNCVIYCPQDAVFRVKKDSYTTGRYVDTDYTKCVGCHICADVCPTGYIDMGMGQ